MLLEEISVDPHILEERSIKQAVAAGALALASLGSPSPIGDANAPPTSAVNVDHRPTLDPFKVAVLSKYKHVDPTLVDTIVAAARKYERPTFPKAEDILAVVGIESSFNPKAQSKLKRDPAKGLMQVRPGVWGLDHAVLADVENQIRIGADILSHYYDKLKDEDAAIHAYNVGITNLRKGRGLNPGYVSKFNKERQLYR